MRRDKGHPPKSKTKTNERPRTGQHSTDSQKMTAQQHKGQAPSNGQRGEMKGLAKDTAIYGISSIVGKFLNYLLVPFYTYTLQSKADYGIVTNLYAWTALLLVLLTYGMETGFFRYANREDKRPGQVYTTAMTCIGFTSVVFAALCCLFSQPIADWLGYPAHKEFVGLLAVVVAMDAFASIPFSYLRYKKRPIRFATLKLLFVVLNIGLNLFFFVACPRLADCALIAPWYEPTYGVGYVFVANFIATAIQTACLLPYMTEEGYDFSWPLLKEMLRYSLPLLVLGVAGVMNMTIDRILFPKLHPAILSTDPHVLALDMSEQIQSELGVYGACVKVALVMMMFTQAFRYAYEPYVFGKHKDHNSVEMYADAMKYYLIFSFLILLGMVFYTDILKFIIKPVYWDGLKVVPWVLWAYLFQGVYFNLSFWYKLTDKTQWGAYLSLTGLGVTLLLQLLLVPRIGYMASAASSTVCYIVITTLSYFIGRRYLPVPYDLRSIGGYTLLTAVLLGIYYGVKSLFPHTWAGIAIGTVLIVVYMTVVVKKDFPLSGLPVIGRYLGKR